MKFTLILGCALLAVAAEPTKDQTKYLSAPEALSFAEAAALSIQQENELNKAQVELERARLKVEQVKAVAKVAQESYINVMGELRKKAGVAPECNPDATGNTDPNKKYRWACPDPPKK